MIASVAMTIRSSGDRKGSGVWGRAAIASALALLPLIPARALFAAIVVMPSLSAAGGRFTDR
jgi:hypothetical protein